MSGRAFVLILIAGAAIGVALATGRSLFWALGGATLALFGLTWAWSWLSLNWLRVNRRVSTRVAQVGQVLEEELRLTNLSWLPRLWVEVRDHSTLPRHNASRIVGLLGGWQWRGWRVRTYCYRRGRFTLGPLTLHGSDPLGVHPRHRALPMLTHVLVYPATYDLSGLALPQHFLAGGNATRQRTAIITPSVLGVRDYQPGDSFNRLHWTLTARRQKLTVREFEIDPISDVWVMLDLHAAVHVGDPQAEYEPHSGTAAPALPPSTEEYAIAAAASLAQHFLKQGRLVGLVASSQHREVLPADRGQRQQMHMLERLAVLQADGEIPFDQVLLEHSPSLPAGSTVIAISPSQDVRWVSAVEHLTHSGVRVMGVAMNAASFGGEGDGQRVIEDLANANAVACLLTCGKSIADALRNARWAR